MTRALRDRGIDNPTELLRAMTVVAAERCIAAFDDDPDTGPGWLAAALRAGGTWESVRNHTRRPPSPSELLRKLDEADQNGTAA